MKIKSIASVVLSLGVATASFGAKAHRDAEGEFKTKSAESATAVKAACGCPVSISVDSASFNKVAADKVDAFKSSVEYEFTNISDKAKEFCGDAASKALFCKNVKAVKIVCKGVSDTDTSYAAASKTFTITTSEQMNSGGAKMKTLMEGW